MWNKRSLPPITQSFATPFLFVVSSLSVTHGQIFNRSMRILWMQRNTCIAAAATFKMIAMSSARSACSLSAVKAQQTRSRLLWTSTLHHIPPLPSPPPLSSRDATDDWATPMSAYRASSVNKCEWPSRSRTYVKTANVISQINQRIWPESLVLVPL